MKNIEQQLVALLRANGDMTLGQISEKSAAGTDVGELGRALDAMQREGLVRRLPTGHWRLTMKGLTK